MSSVYQRGTSINIVQRFWTIDPLTQESTLANPATVVFEILSPDNVTQTFTFGVDGNVTNPDVGIFVCALDPQLPVGAYRYRCDGTGGGVDASSEDTFDVIESGVLTPDQPTVPVTGPCSSWIDGDDVNNFGAPLDGVGENTYLLDDYAYAASDILYNLSARQFPGVCTRTVRPCKPGCGCFGSIAAGLSPWYWTSAFYGGIGPGFYWVNEGGDQCGCGSQSVVKLAGYPVRQILEVKIGGVPLPEFDSSNGARNWRLDNRRNLVRMADPGPPVQDQHWPSCQNRSLDDTEPGTFSIEYTWGADVPLIGRQAASQLARELWLAGNGGDCALPTRVTRVVRGGLTYDKIVSIAEMLQTGSTGLAFFDSFLASYNTNKQDRRSAVFSPDLQQFARKVGQ